MMEKQQKINYVSWALVLGYAKYHKDFIESCKVLGNEQKFSMPLTNPKTNKVAHKVKLRGVIDKIVKVGNSIWVIDHKSTSRMPNRDVLSLSSQGDIYLDYVSQKYGNLKGVIWDYIKKPSIKQKQKETIEEYFERLKLDVESRPEFYFEQFQIKRYKSDLDESKLDIWQTNKLLLVCKNNDLYPKYTNSCQSFWACDYLPICNNGFDEEVDGFEVVKRNNDERLESFSSLKCFRECPRRYKLRYIDGIRCTKKSEALITGSAIHFGLELLYSDDDLDKGIELVNSHYSKLNNEIIKPIKKEKENEDF